MLKPIIDYNLFKKQFASKLYETLDEHNSLKTFLYDLIINQGIIYVVGGYLRDILLDQKSRDIDLLVNIKHDLLISILSKSNLDFSINRFNGIKINLPNFEADIWSIDHNWAFEQNLVLKNGDNLLESIANGSFYNYDSLVINVHNLNLNVKNFNELVVTNELDIIQKRSIYQVKNPTIEGNILRAFYIKKRFGVNFSRNCEKYLNQRINYLGDKYDSSINHLLKFIERYPKYKSSLSKDDLIKFSGELNNTKDGTLNLFDDLN